MKLNTDRATRVLQVSGMLDINAANSLRQAFLVLQIRRMPIGTIFARLRRPVHALALQPGKSLRPMPT
jgi:chemotaxis protein histidine kinase CheA